MSLIELQIKERIYNIEIDPSPISFKTIVNYDVFIFTEEKKFVYSFYITGKNIKKYSLTENILEKIILEKTKEMLEIRIEKNMSGLIIYDFIEKVIKN